MSELRELGHDNDTSAGVSTGEEFDHKDDSNLTVQLALTRLKRKKKRRIALCCIFFLMALMFILVSGMVGVTVSVALNRENHDDNDDTESAAASNSSYTTVTTKLSLATSGTSSSWPTTPSPTIGPPSMLNSKVLDYIDASYEPCEDFYQFSCGRWHSNHPDASEWGTQEELGFDNYNKLAGYLSQWPSDHDPDAIKKAKYIYTACMDVDYIDEHYVEQLKSFMINKGGGWTNVGIFPAQPWSISDNLYKDHFLGSSAFFNFRIVPDDLKSDKPVIKVHQAGLTFGSPETYRNANLFELAREVSDVLNKLHFGTTYSSTAYDIIKFEATLASHWLNEMEFRDNPSALYTPMTLNELTEIFSMDWVKYFNNVFKLGGYSGSFSGSTVVIVETPSYFKAVNSYLTRSIVEDYAKWHLLMHEVSLYTSPLSQDNWKVLKDVAFPKTSKFARDAKLTCVEMLENVMPLAIGRPFVEEFVPGLTRAKVVEVARQIQVAFKQRIAEKDWLDKTTTTRIMQKIGAITEQIAYLDFIKIDRELDKVYANLDISHGINHFEAVRAMQEFIVKKGLSRYFHPIDKTEWLDPLTEVNAYYHVNLNQFVISAGILRPPFYAVNWFPFLVYGGLGAVIGHELTHGFDNLGQQYNQDGNRIKWWTDYCIRNFKQRTQCFVNQYNQYSFQGYTINGQLTLRENIADNGGIHTAYRAYRNVMKGKSEQHGGYSGDQLFFIAYAQLWCSKFTNDAVESSINSDPHCPDPIRMLGSLVNSEEFAVAFQCDKLRSWTRMSTGHRCELW